VLGGLSIGGAPAAHAQNAIESCINKKSHAVRLIPAGSSCRKTETLDTIGATGPQGPQGPQGIARAVGGFGFFTGGNPGTGVGCAIDGSGTPEGNLLCTGSVTATAFNTSSDRAMKTGFQPIAANQVLTRVAALPVSSWTFKGEGVRHIGPMAQDFHAAFKLGDDDKRISLVDEGGVALAAIQGLYQMMQSKDAQIAEQGEEIKLLTARLEKLERVAAAGRNGSDVHQTSASRPPRFKSGGVF
jgi:hypothetical protein